MSALSKMSLRPNGTPLSKVFLPDRSTSRARASAASPARWLHARTTGSRSAIRARQLATTASAVSSPASIRRTRVVAARRFNSAFGMAQSRGAEVSPIYAHLRGHGHAPIYSRLRLLPRQQMRHVASLYNQSDRGAIDAGGDLAARCACSGSSSSAACTRTFVSTVIINGRPAQSSAAISAISSFVSGLVTDRYLRLERIAGWTSHPLASDAFSRRTPIPVVGETEVESTGSAVSDQSPEAKLGPDQKQRGDRLRHRHPKTRQHDRGWHRDWRILPRSWSNCLALISRWRPNRRRWSGRSTARSAPRRHAAFPHARAGGHLFAADPPVTSRTM